MTPMAVRQYRAGDVVEDVCRACKTDRMHTVIAADPAGLPIRVVCGFCHSEHNFRGGPRVDTGGIPPDGRGRGTTPAATRTARPVREPFPIVSERERIAPPMTDLSGTDVEMLLRRIIREEAGITAVPPAEKWRGGTLALRPGNPALQEKTVPIETFFNKIVMVRNRLRTLEQQINATELPPDVKVKLQGYISGCYGSLTSFNVLFADEGDQFKGSGGD
ncbi:hypothetical protein BH24ACI5_BH24ACI5_26860 [soil metagenome]